MRNLHFWSYLIFVAVNVWGFWGPALNGGTKEIKFQKIPFDQKNTTCLSRGYSPLSGIYGHTTVYNSAMHSFYVYGGVSYSAGRVQVSNALFVLHYPTRRWSVVSTGCHKNTEKCIFIGFKGQLNSEWIYELIFSPKMQTKNY